MSQPIDFYTKDGKVRPITKATIRRGARPAFAQQVEQNVKAPEPTLKVTRYSDETLVLSSEVGSTKIWVGHGVLPDEQEDLIGSFRRLPPSARAEVKSVEVYSGKGRELKVGEYEFTEGGHWDKSSGTVRVFANEVGSKWIQDFRVSDDIIAHEAGHALYDKLEHQGMFIEKYPHEETSKIEEQLRETREKKRNEIYAKYNPQQERLNKEYLANLDKRIETWGAEEGKRLRLEANRIKAKSNRITKKRDQEIALVNKVYDTEEAIEKLQREQTPTWSKLKEFRHATDEEGGLTRYSDSYVKKHESTEYTENFAEAMKVWYSGSSHPGRSSELAEEHPKTYKAYSGLIQNEVAGHAVSLQDRPIIRMRLY